MTVFIAASYLQTGFKIADNDWHHLCVVRSSFSLGNWEIYDNAELVASHENHASSEYIRDGGVFCNIQEQDWVGGGFVLDEAFSGMMGMQYFYAYPLSSEQVTGLYEGTNIPDDWVFNYQVYLN